LYSLKCVSMVLLKYHDLTVISFKSEFKNRNAEFFITNKFLIKLCKYYPIF